MSVCGSYLAIGFVESGCTKKIESHRIHFLRVRLGKCYFCSFSPIFYYASATKAREVQCDISCNYNVLPSPEIMKQEIPEQLIGFSRLFQEQVEFKSQK